MPGMFGCMAALFLAAFATIVVLRAFAAPWLGWLSYVLAVRSLVSGIAGLTVTTGGTSALGYFPLGSLVIIRISSIYMLRYRPSDIGQRLTGADQGVAASGTRRGAPTA